ncbi:MAG: hypothetical protein JXR96_24555 [Deltaproteobacteria bacterium]|nr:hypothetical protein [Deltaproteobacteria bacterium]
MKTTVGYVFGSILAIAVCASCGGGGSDYPSGRACSEHDDCQQGLWCFELTPEDIGGVKTCVKKCAQDRDCEALGAGSDGKFHDTCCDFGSDWQIFCAPADCWGKGTPYQGTD